MIKRKSLLRTGIGIGIEIAAFFILEIVVIVIKTIGESIHHPTTIDEIDRERAKTWKAYKEGHYRE